MSSGETPPAQFTIALQTTKLFHPSDLQLAHKRHFLIWNIYVKCLPGSFADIQQFTPKTIIELATGYKEINQNQGNILLQLQYVFGFFP